MGIGTSLGAYYDDAHHAAAAAWDPKYETEENKSDIQKSVDNALKDTTWDADPDMIRLPLETSASPEADRKAEVTADHMQKQMIVGSDPKNIYNDSGVIVGYDNSIPAPTPNAIVADAFNQLPHSQGEFNEIDASAN